MRIKQQFNYFDVDSYMQKQVNQLGQVKTMMLQAAKRSNDLNVIYTIDAKEGSYITEAEIVNLMQPLKLRQLKKKTAIRQRKQKQLLLTHILELRRI